MATQSIPTGLQTIPLTSIFENINNPRKFFEPVALKELAKSIEAHGVRQPILVRPDPMGGKKFELIVGARRFRASKLAGKTEVPAIVDVLSDREALEVMVIENQQRQDVSPLIARLQPLDQVKAILACFREGLDSQTAFEPQNPKLSDLVNMTHEVMQTDLLLIPEKALREWIQDNVNLRLKDAPWDLTHEFLVQEAGSCVKCPKRSGSNPALFAELTVKGEDTCFDPACFKLKREAYVQLQIDVDRRKAREAAKGGSIENPEPKHEPLRQLSEQSGYTKPKPDQRVLKAGQWLPAKKGECDSVEQGLIVRGEHAGEKKLVCCNGACKVHKHHLSGDGASRSGGHDYATEDFNRHKGNIRDAKKAIARRSLVRSIIDEVGTKLPIALLRDLVRDKMRLDWAPGAAITLNLLAIKSDKPAQKLKELIEKGSETVLYKLLVADFLEVQDHADDKKEREQLSALAKAVGIKNPHGVLTREDDRVNKLQACRECGCTEETACQFYEGSHKSCAWKEPDLCSNPKCLARAKSKSVQTSAKPKKGKS
jgi:ParB family chromosome partitioning protein